MVTSYEWICLHLYMHIYAHTVYAFKALYINPQCKFHDMYNIPCLHIDSTTMLLTYQLIDSCDW